MAFLLQEVTVDVPVISSSPDLQQYRFMQALLFVSMPKTIFLFYIFYSPFNQNPALADWSGIIWPSQIVSPKGLYPFHQWFFVLPPE